MISILRKITVFAAILLIFYLGYQAFLHDGSKKWKDYTQPQLAAYTSLEKDEEILKELDLQTRFNSYKQLDAAYFVKPTIFETIQRN